MQLNQADGGGGSGGPGGDLATSPAQKKKAAKYIEEHLAPDTQSAGRLADEESSAVAGGGSPSGPIMGTFLPQQKWHPPMASAGGGGEFRDWATKSGLSTAMSAWERQVKALEGRLTHYMSALRGANNLYQGQDGLTGSQFNGTNGPLLQSPNSPFLTNPSPRSGISDY